MTAEAEGEGGVARVAAVMEAWVAEATEEAATAKPVAAVSPRMLQALRRWTAGPP